MTITGLSRITQETGFSKEQGCMSSNHVRLSDLIPERKSPFDSDGGNDWFSWEKNSSRLPSLIWQAIYNWENNWTFFFSVVTWLFDVLLVVTILKVGSLFFRMRSDKLFGDDFRRLFTKLILRFSECRLNLQYSLRSCLLYCVYSAQEGLQNFLKMNSPCL